MTRGQTAVRHIILVGFMGTGKSTVGRKLADALGWRFVDSDQRIEEEEQISIREMFVQKGEAYFRDTETAAIRSVLQEDGCVLATGGGAVLREENRRLMLEGGLVVALEASEAVIIERVRGDGARPLLQGDVEERVHALMESRRGAYEFAHLHIDTDHRTPDEAVAFILQTLQPVEGADLQVE